MAEKTNVTTMKTLTDSAPPAGQVWALVNMVSPEGPRQKGDTYAFRLLEVCPSWDELTKRNAHYHHVCPEMDIYPLEVGKWIPWVWNVDDIKDPTYHQKALGTLLEEHKKQYENVQDHFYQRIENDRRAAAVARAKKSVAKAAGDDGTEDQEEEATSVENAISAKYRIMQLQNVVDCRSRELEFWRQRYAEDFSAEEREQAEGHNYPPLNEVTDMFTV